MTTQIQIRRGTAAQWTAANTLLAEGELAAETDTGKFKIGNGSTLWNALSYSSGIQGTPGVDGVDGVDGEVTLAGVQTLTNKTLTTPSVNGYTEGVVTANTSTTYTIDIATASIQNLTLTGNCTYTFPTATAGKSFLLMQKQDATGSRTVTWPSSVRWAGGTAPIITATASKTDVISFVADGTYWLGFFGGFNFTRA